MDLTTSLLLFGGFYAILLFFDTFFKTCAHYPYVQFLKNTGFEIGFLRIKWKTSVFNRLILRLGSSRTRIFNYWFDTGLIATLVFFPFALGLLLVANYKLLSRKEDSDEQLVLEPLVPGYNLPTSEIGYYAVTLLICSVIHELGHALAAVKEDVHLIDVGVNIFLCLPVAYVNISSEKLASLKQSRILRIMCAGIWHNLVLVLIAGIVYFSLSFILSPFYIVGKGVVVNDVLLRSPLSGAKGLFSGNVITKINDCVVENEESWQQCLSRARTVKPGYCISTDLAHDLDESGPLTQLSNGMWECCTISNPQNMCFEYLELTGGAVELPPHMCLPTRKIIESSQRHCFPNKILCPENSHCVRPLLSNTTVLLTLTRQDEKDVVYIGHPSDIFVTVTVSSFVPKYHFPSFGFASILNKLLKYLIVFSSGLAILNILPCIFFDGQHIVTCVVAIVLRKRTQRHKVQIISMVIVVIGTILLMFNFIFTLWTIALRK